jgi:hypothetical protein
MRTARAGCHEARWTARVASPKTFRQQLVDWLSHQLVGLVAQE